MQINEEQLKKFILDSGLISRDDFSVAEKEAENILNSIVKYAE